MYQLICFIWDACGNLAAEEIVPLEIWVDGPWKYSSIHTKNCTFFSAQKVAHGFGLIKLILEFIL